MPKAFLIDSDVLIDHLRGKPEAREFFEAKIEVGSLLFTSVISRVEIFAGIRKGEEKVVNSLLGLLTPVDIDVIVADTAGEYLKKFSRSHTLGVGDAIIAATSKEMALTLVTRNIKHYPMKDITVVKPY